MNTIARPFAAPIRLLPLRVLVPILAALASVLGLPGASPGATAETVGFRGPARDGTFAGRLPHRRPSAVWTFRTEGPVHGSPIWVNGLVIAGSGDGHLYAIDGASGSERWRFKTGGAVDGPAAYAAGNVVAESRDGFLHAVDVRTGKEKWKVALGAELPFKWGWDFYLSAPAVAGARLYVGSGSGEVLAVEAATGKVAWRFPTGGRVRSSPSVVDGVVYVGSFDGHLYAIDAQSGALRWKFATQGVSIDLQAAGFDRRSIQSSPAVTTDLVVVGCRDGRLYGVERATGKERWNFDHQVSWVVGSPAIAGDRAIVGSSDGRFVQAVDLATGKEIWRHRTDSNALSSPARAGDVVVLGDGSGAVMAFDVSTGRELWRFLAGDTVHATPLIRDGRIYVGSDDGKIYALAGDLAAAPAPAALRAVYYDPRVPYKTYDGDRELRDALVAESYQWVTRSDVADFLNSRIADRAPSVIVFATDSVPAAIADAAAPGGALVRRYLDAGGKIVWLGEIPFLILFDPANQLLPVKPADLNRTKTLFGFEADSVFEGEYRAQANDVGRRWGLPAGWWVGQGPIANPPAGMEVLARDEHGHAAAWVQRFGGREGTGLVAYWGRERRVPDPRIVRSLAEFGLP
ncbi:MAG: PQQ-binding-like beta-propeller repeat protein [Acidobacteriota bacterium]